MPDNPADERKRLWGCVVLSGAMLYVFRDDVIDTLALLQMVLWYYVGLPLEHWMAAHPVQSSFPEVNRWASGGVDWQATSDPLLNVLIGLATLIWAVVKWCVVLVGAVVAVVVLLVALVGIWLYQGGRYLYFGYVQISPTAIFLCFAVAAYFVGRFLHKVGFPLLWRMAHPVVAGTFGEFYYLKRLKKTSGDPAISLRQPVYLIVGIALVSFGVWRIVIAPLLGGIPALKISLRENIIEDQLAIASIRNLEQRRLSFGETSIGVGAIRLRKGETIPLYAWPRKDSDILIQIPGPLALDYTKKYGSWYQVSYMLRTGWVYGGGPP